VAGPARPLQFELGKSFSLRAGESAQAADAALRVGFEGVTSDSRCPKGEQCVWAGDATVQVWLQEGSGPRQTRELHTAPGVAQGVQALGHDVRLLRLDPYPVAGSAIARGAFAAMLIVTQSSGSSAQPER
jgi:hypothetical protein